MQKQLSLTVDSKALHDQGGAGQFYFWGQKFQGRVDCASLPVSCNTQEVIVQLQLPSALLIMGTQNPSTL